VAILKLQRRFSVRGESVYKIVSSRYFVNKDANLIEVSNEIVKHRESDCIGVIDDNENAIGILSRKKIFDLLGKSYGKEILSFRNVEFLTEECMTFQIEENILNVVDRIKERLEINEPTYFLVKYDKDKFAGIFSNIDLMIYLSKILQKDILLASNLQRSIIKEEEVVEENFFSLIFCSNMMKEIGGDFYFFKKHEDRYIFSLCDVSGKGISASLLTAFLRGVVVAYNFSLGLEGLISLINTELHSVFELQKFVTGIFIDFHFREGNMEIYDMGHSLIYLLRNNKLMRLKTNRNNLPLGLSSVMKIVPNSFGLEKDDLLILLTDGIIEQTNFRGEELGEEAVLRMVKIYQNNSLKEIKNNLINGVFTFKEKEPQHDDFSFSLLKYHGNSSSSIVSL